MFLVFSACLIENCRLIGSIDMAFECGDVDAQTFAKLCAPVKSSWRNIAGGEGTRDGYLSRDTSVRFDTNGEPGSRDCYTIHRCDPTFPFVLESLLSKNPFHDFGTVPRLLRGCNSGFLVPKDDSTISVLSALVDLARPDESAHLPWKPQPLLRAVCPKAGAKQVGNVLRVRAFIYFRRLLFEMIAYPPLMTIMKAIEPVGHVRRTAALPPLASPTFVSHVPTDTSNGPEYSFSLAGLMKSQVVSTEMQSLIAMPQAHLVKQSCCVFV